jgi:hypothetical protein
MKQTFIFCVNVIYFFHSGLIFGENFLVTFILLTALYRIAIQIPTKIKNGRGYLTIHPANTTFQKFQYGRR